MPDYYNPETTGYNIKATLKLGPVKKRVVIDISRFVKTISYSIVNFEFLPSVEMTFILSTYYTNLLANPYELDLEILEKGGNSGTDVPRSKLSGTFVAFPSEVTTINKSNDSDDASRIEVTEVFFPKDISSTINSETTLSLSNTTLLDAIKKLFKGSCSGSTKLKCGKFSNNTSIPYIVLARDKLFPHIRNLYNKYGFNNNSTAMYADFNNFYIYNVNENIVGSKDPIVFYWNKEKLDKKYTINNYHYWIRTPPSISTSTGNNANSYSSEVSLLTHPRHTLYKKTKTKLKKESRKNKTTSQVDSFDYYDIIKKTKTTIFAGNDTTLPGITKLTNDMSYNITADVTVIDPMILTDWVIGRKVKFDTDITDYFGFDMTGYISGYTVTLNSNNGVKWDGIANITVSIVSNGAFLK